MAKPVLIAYTTYAGSTKDVAQAIAEELSKCGASVELRTLEDVTALDGFAAAVIGAPMILAGTGRRAASSTSMRRRRARCRWPIL